MQLNIADQSDALKIAAQVYHLWSAGLKKADYRQLFLSTYQQSWSKRNVHRMFYKIENEIAFTCKTVRLSLFTKTHDYQILGLASIFTAPAWRKKGLAGHLVESVIEQAEKQNLAGVLLFSAIDKSFYTSLGFRSLGCLDFEIYPQNYSSMDGFVKSLTLSHCGKNISIEMRSAEVLVQRSRLQTSQTQNSIFCFSSFEPWFSENEFIEILRCHRRWTARQPYAIKRSRDYFSFQLARFLYFATYSTTSQNNWFLTIVKDDRRIIGYAFTECSGTNMRILELVGDDSARAYLWQALIEQAQKMNLTTMCGFESIIRDFIPSCRLDHSLFSLKPLIKTTDIQCSERLWSQPMFLSLNPNLDDLFSSHPCPLLELDYI